MSTSTDRPTTPDGNKNFKSKFVKKQAQDKQDSIKKNLEDNKARAEQARKIPRDENKINRIKDAGKALINKFIKGVTSEERANVTADLDDTLPYRYVEVYQSATQAYAEHTDFARADEFAQKLDTQLFGAISIAMAIKLHKSSTDTEKRSNKMLSALECNIKLPKKLAVLIDQMGKTDVPGDNHFRIRNQNFSARRHLARGVYNLIKQGELSEYMEDDFGYKWQDLQTIMENPSLFSNMVDNSSWSVDRIREIGKTIYNDITRDNFEFWDPDDTETKFYFRLPKVDFDNLDVKSIGNIMSNKVFSVFKFNKDALTKMISGLVLACCKHTWAKKPGEKMEKLDESFKGSWFEGKTFKDVLAYCGVWNINYYFSDTILNDIAITAIERWNTGMFKHFSKFLEMHEINFTEHGSPAQLVQVDSKNIETKKKGIMNYVTYSYKGKAKSSVALKNLTENDFLLGVMSGFTKNLDFNSVWNIEFNSNNKAILVEFLKNDFKDTY